MKTLILAILTTTALSSNANAQSQKDRGGGEVPYAEGTGRVTLSWRHTQSLVKIEGNSAELLYKALQAPEGPNKGLLARVGEVVKEKGNVKCISTQSAGNTYRCEISIQN